jgi:hypothetical protein
LMSSTPPQGMTKPPCLNWWWSSSFSWTSWVSYSSQTQTADANCCVIAKSNTNNEKKRLKYKTRKMAMKNSQQCISQKSIPFTSVVRPPFVGRRAIFFTYRKWPHVKWIKQEYTRLILEILRWVFT